MLAARINHERGFNSPLTAGYLQCSRRRCAVYRSLWNGGGHWMRRVLDMRVTRRAFNLSGRG